MWGKLYLCRFVGLEIAPPVLMADAPDARAALPFDANRSTADAGPNDANRIAVPGYTTVAGSEDSIFAGVGERRDRGATGEANDTRRMKCVFRMLYPATT